MKVEGYPIKWRYIRVFHRAPNPGFSEEPLNDGGEYELWRWELKRDHTCVPLARSSWLVKVTLGTLTATWKNEN